jgi:hypothetical protein
MGTYGAIFFDPLLGCARGSAEGAIGVVVFGEECCFGVSNSLKAENVGVSAALSRKRKKQLPFWVRKVDLQSCVLMWSELLVFSWAGWRTCVASL